MRSSASRSGHSLEHADRERRVALILVVTGLVRVVGWSTLTILYWAHNHWAVGLFSTVRFVALVSILALVETAFSQVAASLAQLTAGRGHQAAELARIAAEEGEVLDLLDLSTPGGLTSLEEHIDAKLREIDKRLSVIDTRLAVHPGKGFEP